MNDITASVAGELTAQVVVRLAAAFLAGGRGLRAGASRPARRPAHDNSDLRGGGAGHGCLTAAVRPERRRRRDLRTDPAGWGGRAHGDRLSRAGTIIRHKNSCARHDGGQPVVHDVLGWPSDAATWAGPDRPRHCRRGALRAAGRREAYPRDWYGFVSVKLQLDGTPEEALREHLEKLGVVTKNLDIEYDLAAKQRTSVRGEVQAEGPDRAAAEDRARGCAPARGRPG